MDSDALFDKLCDLIVAANVTPQDAALALVGTLHACLHKLPAIEREAWFENLTHMRRIYNETFGALVKPEQTRVH